MWKDWVGRYRKDALVACGELALLLLQTCNLKQASLQRAQLEDAEEVENHLQDLLDAADLVPFLFFSDCCFASF